MNWYVYHQGETHGPMTPFDVRKRFGKETEIMICPVGSDQWFTSETLEELSKTLCKIGEEYRFISPANFESMLQSGLLSRTDSALGDDGTWMTIGATAVMKKIGDEKKATETKRRKWSERRSLIAGSFGALAFIIGGAAIQITYNYFDTGGTIEDAAAAFERFFGAPSPAPASPAASVAPAPTVREVYVLPRDLELFKKELQGKIVRWNQSSLALCTAKPGGETQPVKVVIEAGLLCGTAYLTAQTETIAITACGEFPFRALVINEAQWNENASTRRTECAIARPDSSFQRVLVFLAACDSAGASWHVRQAGVWMLRNNISFDVMATKWVGSNMSDIDVEWVTHRTTENQYAIVHQTFSTPTPFFKGGPSIRVASLSDIAAAESLISSCGIDASSLALPAEARRRLAYLLADFSAAAVKDDFFDKAKPFLGSKELEAALTAILASSSYEPHRRKSFEMLCDGGLHGDRAALLSRALSDKDPEMRLIAAITLFTRFDDRRSYPILAAHEKQTRFVPFFLVKLNDRIERLTGKKRGAAESATEYWEKAAGWQALEREFGNVADVKAEAMLAGSMQAFVEKKPEQTITRRDMEQAAQNAAAARTEDLQKMTLSGSPLEIVTVRNTNEAFSSMRTERDARYIVEITGTVTNSSSDGDKSIFDALWKFSYKGRPLPKPVYDPQLRIGNKNLTYLAGKRLDYAQSHRYRFPYTGDGEKIRFITEGAIVMRKELLSGSYTAKIYRR